ncbi:patatin-like phospholipase family protein [Nocardioides sp. Kera G14]|uniref:patatin-like phospholipase family protein n=1 Tax=Nocardioides sp. Kera G14 TaxID=2884264 RepID=UPI001D0FE7A8|nr:patatin-like phospholipase family protein [Nocardioides sp. Kera G14]UDY22950.1 patatin-like phospholipase family protein [Nocardioides sp. Kera G14]
MASTGRVALALGSGGARGYAHLGAVEEIRSRGYEIVAVAGTSMGAVVGGLVAAGKDEEFADWASSLRQRDILRLLDPKWRAGGAINASGVMAELSGLVGDQTIEDLPIPFTAIATDLESRREVWFQSGPLVKAIRASIGIPGMFVPVAWNGRVLVDGGLLNPLPVEPVVGVDADFTVAVSLQGARAGRGNRGTVVEDAGEVTADEDGTGVLHRLLGAFGRSATPDDQMEDADLTTETRPVTDLRVTDVLALSWDAMQEMIARYRLAGQPPDVLVSVPADAARTLDFHRAAEMIDLGRKLAAEALDATGH